MNFKKPKYDVLNDARYVANDSFKNTLQSVIPYGNFDRNSIIDAIGQAVSIAIYEALASVIENIYTDADFERDMNLGDNYEPTKR